MFRSFSARAVVVAGAAIAVCLLTAGPASAHVTVNAASAVQGGYTKVAFRVPNEKDNASTTQLEVSLPADTPIPSVSLKPVQGWTATTEKTKLANPIKNDDGEITEAVTKITWKADAASAIKPGQFQEFEVALGPLPKTDQLMFKALQTYSDGDIVRWIDVPEAGQPQPDHPAPILKLAAAAPANTATAEESDSGAVAWLGVVGIVFGLGGLTIGLLAYRRAAALPRLT